MINFKLCNGGKSVAGINAKGETVSYSIEAEAYKQWLLEGGVPEPEFTAEETAANAIAESYLNKWNQIIAQIDQLTVIVNGHKYAANKSAMIEINIKISSLDGTEIVNWYEVWGSFQTNKVELQQVVIAAGQAEQLIIDQVMGA